METKKTFLETLTKSQLMDKIQLLAVQVGDTKQLKADLEKEVSMNKSWQKENKHLSKAMRSLIKAGWEV